MKQELTDHDILSKAVWNKDTAYDAQVSYTCPDGYIVHVVKSSEFSTRKLMEDTLIQQVREHL